MKPSVEQVLDRAQASLGRSGLRVLTLPDDSRLWRRGFLIGCATSSYQIEGAIDHNGRIESVWDRFCRRPGTIVDGSDGAVACNHIEHWQADVDLIAALGFDIYRFSMAWPRVMGKNGRINEAGMDFYRRLIERLHEHGIEPLLTLFHWDMPQWIEARGGWPARDTAYRFADYADAVSRALGSGVRMWATLNEPWCSAFLGYDLGIHAPGVRNRGAAFQAAHHLLLAHGLAVQAIRSNASDVEVGIVLNPDVGYPATESEADQRAAELVEIERNALFLDPLFGRPAPDDLYALGDGLAPQVESGDADIIAARLDWLGVNYYTRSVVAAHDGIRGYRHVDIPDVPRTAMGWEVFPEGLAEVLRRMAARWDLPAIYITENGAAYDDTAGGEVVDDPLRQQYIIDHLAALDAVINEGVDVRGWLAWSLLDNFEWAEGYTKRFGIVRVDYDTQQRMPKGSALMLRTFNRMRRERNVGGA